VPGAQHARQGTGQTISASPLAVSVSHCTRCRRPKARDASGSTGRAGLIGTADAAIGRLEAFKRTTPDVQPDAA
jgi:hypothetical protein